MEKWSYLLAAIGIVIVAFLAFGGMPMVKEAFLLFFPKSKEDASQATDKSKKKPSVLQKMLKDRTTWATVVVVLVVILLLFLLYTQYCGYSPKHTLIGLALYGGGIVVLLAAAGSFNTGRSNSAMNILPWWILGGLVIGIALIFMGRGSGIDTSVTLRSDGYTVQTRTEGGLLHYCVNLKPNATTEKVPTVGKNIEWTLPDNLQMTNSSLNGKFISVKKGAALNNGAAWFQWKNVGTTEIYFEYWFTKPKK